MCQQEQGYPLDTYQRWKQFRQGNEMARLPGFSCQLFEEDDAHEKEGVVEREEVSQLFRASTAERVGN